MTFDQREFESLLFDYENGELSAENSKKFNAVLTEYAEARSQFAKWQIVQFSLQQDAEDYGLPLVQQPAVSANQDSQVTTSDHYSQSRLPRTQADPTRFWKVLAIGAAIAICLLGGRILQLESLKSDASLPSIGTQANGDLGANDSSANSVARQEKTSRGLALVTRLIGTNFQADSQPATLGGALSKGVFALDSGNAQIEFFSGATLVVEGPARLELLSADKVRCLSGRLRAQVPPAARGFEILVQDTRIVDLGTEFGVNVSASGTELQVFDGEVELHADNLKSEKQLLTAGQAISWSAEKSAMSAVRAAAPETYLGLSDLTSEAEDQEQANFERWSSYSNKLRQDPRLITYYSMEQQSDWRRKLRNSQNDSELDGAIVGARISDGRWSQKQALEFKHPGDRVKVKIPGEYGSLSFVCWVRIDSLDRWYNSLFLTDNYQRGEPHWQILDTGQLFFSVRVSREKGGPEHKVVLSPVFWKPSMSGQWLNLATTYDVDAKATSHYLNGELLVRESIPDAQLVPTTRIGLASIGNWSSPTKPDEVFAIRNLNGRMDEFMIFSEALSPEEIREIYAHGKP